MKESILAIFVLIIRQLCEAGRILVIIPVPSHSHHVAFQPLWKTLSLRGHEIVVLTTDPTNDVTLTNLTEINFKHNYETFKDLDWVKFRLNSMPWSEIMQKRMWAVADQLVHNIYKHPEVRKMYAPDSGVKFDVVLAEAIFTPGIYALAYRFNAPLIGITSLGLTTFQHFIIGNPVLPSHRSSWDLYQRDNSLSFMKRLGNFLNAYRLIYNWFYDFIPRQQRIAEYYLGNDLPLLSDLESNMSAIFSSQQATISFARSNVPNVIPYETMHVKKTSTPLPKDLKQFIDESPVQGFIYVSFGTNVKTTQMPNETLEIFIEVFSQLSCRVIWKYDGEFTQKHENIFTSKWLPQQSILAHPKIRIYFYQGGLQSTQEAFHFAVPLIGMPVVADQDHQITKLVDLGVARRVDIENITKEGLQETIHDILNNRRYKDQMLAVQRLNKKRPYDSSQNLIWWTEFIMSRRGAPHLRCNIANEPWYQKYDTDIIAFISIILFLLIISVVMIFYLMIVYLFRYYGNVVLLEKNTKEKTN